ncbi:alpha-galactosidase [Cellulomonas sp. DKR-3]|uniref:Alpha-galactosidase n=1 Tax=Cellulomonas fulva TaxID=2835530 RepID=A0ABM6FGE0_9CELL|nr:alpha-galactosidase [Cellulomonas fulva]MBT0994196.1 alpha-galactosidase [Cellulomonas fulva]
MLVHLRAAGVSLVLTATDDRLPSVLHWGRDLGDGPLGDLERASVAPLAGAQVDAPVPVSVLPVQADAWLGTPAVAGHREVAGASTGWSPAFVVRSSSVDERAAGGAVHVTASDEAAGLELALEIELTPQGVVRTRATLTNAGADGYVVDALAPALPVPGHARELVDLAGRWAKERTPQRHAFTVGTHVREGRRGRTGADATLVLVAGEQGTDFRRGECWGVHVAWSGNHRTQAERTPDGTRLLAGGELLLPGEVRLAAGSSYTSPWLYGTYGDGLDELAGRFHALLRDRPQHPRTPRPVTLNVWEAVYFDHRLPRLLELAELAASVGVERYVLDDGWFRGRRDEHAGLGDWFVDDGVWPDGLTPLVERVHGLGMQFGLWFEPEMVNPDSDLAREHPDWILQVPGRLPPEARFQQVLDVSRPEVFEYLRSRVVQVVRDNGVDYVKWDHNRDLVDAGGADGSPRVHAHTLAVYALFDAIRADCPGLEIESCSSGGARVDLGILERTDRVWASDCIDAHERQEIQRWTAQLLPPELVGSHVGARKAHTTGRVLDLSFRATTALLGSFGIEWDLAQASDDERAELAAWITLYKGQRGLLHTGTTVRDEAPDAGLWLHGVVAPDRSRAVYALVQRERPATWPPGRVRLPGLDPDATYEVAPVGPFAPHNDWDRPAWWSEPVRLTGHVLATVGIQSPAIEVDHAALIETTRLP